MIISQCLIIIQLLHVPTISQELLSQLTIVLFMELTSLEATQVYAPLFAKVAGLMEIMDELLLVVFIIN